MTVAKYIQEAIEDYEYFAISDELAKSTLPPDWEGISLSEIKDFIEYQKEGRIIIQTSSFETPASSSLKTERSVWRRQLGDAVRTDEATIPPSVPTNSKTATDKSPAMLVNAAEAATMNIRQYLTQRPARPTVTTETPVKKIQAVAPVMKKSRAP